MISSREACCEPKAAKAQILPGAGIKYAHLRSYHSKEPKGYAGTLR